MARINFYQSVLIDAKPGAEFRAAMDEAKSSNTPVSLIVYFFLSLIDVFISLGCTCR